jgi:hypothetical protein
LIAVNAEWADDDVLVETAADRSLSRRTHHAAVIDISIVIDVWMQPKV